MIVGIAYIKCPCGAFFQEVKVIVNEETGEITSDWDEDATAEKYNEHVAACNFYKIENDA